MLRFLLVVSFALPVALAARAVDEPSQQRRKPEPELLAGAAEVDITPDYPVRLNGFGSRRTESEGVRQRIYARALAVGAPGSWRVLIAADTLGPRPSMLELAFRAPIGATVADRHRLNLRQVAVTATHTHTAPMLAGICPTIFGVPIPEEHFRSIERCTADFHSKLAPLIDAAIKNAQPATFSFALGSVKFAANRRTKGGPVDHDLPLLAVRSAKDGKLIALWTSYACHAVTLHDNKISGDWPGYAAEQVQRRHPGAVCLVSIGCGADSNPTTGIQGSQAEAALDQGMQVADEIDRLLKTPMRPITAGLTVQEKTITLPLAKLPARAEWEERAKRQDAIGHHARFMLEKLAKGEKLTEEISYPISAWTFGGQLALVFLPGEVVVDYAHRLKDELDRHRLWINAYSNDSPGYVPSERILKEGGYEGGGAMVYYGIPGPYAPGLEEKIVNAVKELVGPGFASPVDSRKLSGTRPLSPQQSLATLQTYPQFEIELVAAEPLVASPVAIDWGLDGKLYVCEMRDYPSGIPGQPGPGGRVRALSKSKPEGPYDRSEVFLEGIPFPTGITSWRKGLLVCAAPDILYAEDTDGDGKADMVKKLYSGFGTHNFQARVNSLEYGLDGWIYGSCGLFGGNILSRKTGKTYALGDRDFRIKPETGEIEAVQGRTQQGRTRDDWGNWFGCDNSNLAWHYPLDEAMLRRNPYLTPPPAHVLVPQENRVYPRTTPLRHERTGPPGLVTAACGLTAYRDDLLGPGFQVNLFVCEPANLLVHRMILEPKQSTFVGKRAPEDAKGEFLTSSDPWFRPVQAKTGPDGALYIVDMHRFVIEHPQWIPFDEKERLDLRAGSTMGRIFRVKPKGTPLRPVPRLDQMKPAELAAALESTNGWIRDRASDAAAGSEGAAPRQPRPGRGLAEAYGLAMRENAAGAVKEVLDRATDPYFQAAFDSGINAAALPRLAEALLARLEQPEAGPEALGLALRLARYALRMRDGESLAKMAAACASTPRSQQGWRLALLAALMHERDLAAHGADAPWLMQLAKAVGFARVTAAEASSSESDRLAALRCLGFDSAQRKEDQALALSLLAPQTSSTLQAAALELLGRLPEPPDAPSAASLWAPLSPTLKNHFLDLYLDRPAWTPALLELVEKNAVPAGSFDAARRRRLLAAPHAVSKAKAERLFAGTSNPDRQKTLAAYADAAHLAGDRARGLRVFTRACSACHRLGDVGHAVGPDLATVAGKSSSYLLQEILDPNKNIDSRFVEYVALLKSGKLTTGLIASESSHSVTLRSQEGKEQTLLRADLDEFRSSGKSLMPEGLEKDLSKQDLADVIAFLRTAETKPKFFKGNAPTPVVVKNGCYSLLATNAEVRGPSLVYEFPFRNLGFWQSSDDYAAWRVQVEQGGRFDVYLDWSCAADSAGNRWRLDGARAPLTGTVSSTGGWNRFRRENVGVVDLPNGLLKLELRGDDGPLNGALFDLRAVHLIPAGREPALELDLPGNDAGSSNQDGKPPTDAGSLVRFLLDEAKPARERAAAITQNLDWAAELLNAMTKDLKPGDTAEENRRIPWIWRVAIAVGKKDDAKLHLAVLRASLPEAGQPLLGWQAVAIGGGLVNGVSQQKRWPKPYFAELIKADAALAARWSRALALSAAMADNEQVIPGTRYDALRMVALLDWEQAKPQLLKYLKKGTNEELQQGAVSGLSDCEESHVGEILADRCADLAPGNRALAVDALLRSEDRVSKLLSKLEEGSLQSAWLSPTQRRVLLEHKDEAQRNRAAKVLGP